MHVSSVGIAFKFKLTRLLKDINPVNAFPGPSVMVLEHLQPFHWFDKSVPKADLKSTARDAGRLKGRACVPNIALRSAVKLQGFLGIQGVG